MLQGHRSASNGATLPELHPAPCRTPSVGCQSGQPTALPGPRRDDHRRGPEPSAGPISLSGTCPGFSRPGPRLPCPRPRLTGTRSSQPQHPSHCQHQRQCQRQCQHKCTSYPQPPAQSRTSPQCSWGGCHLQARGHGATRLSQLLAAGAECDVTAQPNQPAKRGRGRGSLPEPQNHSGVRQAHEASEMFLPVVTFEKCRHLFAHRFLFASVLLPHFPCVLLSSVNNPPNWIAMWRGNWLASRTPILL